MADVTVDAGDLGVLMKAALRWAVGNPRLAGADVAACLVRYAPLLRPEHRDVLAYYLRLTDGGEGHRRLWGEALAALDLARAGRGT